MFRVTRARFHRSMSTWSALAVVKSTKVSELEMNWPFIQSLLAWNQCCGFCFLSYRSLMALNCGMNLLLLHNHLQRETLVNFWHALILHTSFMDGRVKSSVLNNLRAWSLFHCTLIRMDQVASSAVKLWLLVRMCFWSSSTMGALNLLDLCCIEWDGLLWHWHGASYADKKTSQRDFPVIIIMEDWEF